MTHQQETFYESYVKDKKSIEHPDQIKQLYDRWAPTYNKEIADDDDKWPAPKIVAGKLKELMQKDGVLNEDGVEILDVCGGTGKLALEMRKCGVTKAIVDAHDGSMEMLKVAQGKGIYRNVFQALLYGDKDHENLPKSLYDYVTAVGCFNAGGMDRHCFRHLYNAAKPNGKIVFAVTINYYDEKFDQLLEKYENEGKIEILERTPMPEYIKMMESEDPRGMLVCVKKLK